MINEEIKKEYQENVAKYNELVLEHGQDKGKELFDAWKKNKIVIKSNEVFLKRLSKKEQLDFENTFGKLEQ